MSKAYLNASTEQIKHESKQIRFRRLKREKAEIARRKEEWKDSPEKGPFYSNRAMRRSR